MTPESDTRKLKLLRILYADQAASVARRLEGLLARHRERLPAQQACPWTQRDTVLITYGDQLRAEGERPLQTLGRFLRVEQLQEAFSLVHILPFYPATSDDGFSVQDYRRVDPAIGEWDDVRQLSQYIALAFDLVLNHVSAESEWFLGYRRGAHPWCDYFIEMDPATDLTEVTRPRSLPLLTPVDTHAGKRHVWTTFSADQIDLNFANPDVLLEFIDIMLFYVEQGARMLRLDAIAYLWKEVGTSCIHLPQTHAAVRLFRAVLDELAPDVWLLTETNVPHAENISYFGKGDEAQLVYQFSLPPLLLDAFLHRDAGPLQAWLHSWQPAPPGCTFLNFTASHDGVGVRPLEGLVSEERLTSLVQLVRARGGRVNTRRMADGRDAPYELNISYFSALGEPQGLAPELHQRRFLASQAVMLGLSGVPATYFHSLVATENDDDGVERSGMNRRINRHKYAWDELQQRLTDARQSARPVLNAYRQMLQRRAAQPAFHPDATQQALPTPPWLIAFRRVAQDRQSSILVLANVSDSEQSIDLTRFTDDNFSQDILSGRQVDDLRTFPLDAYQAAWLLATGGS